VVQSNQNYQKATLDESRCDVPSRSRWSTR
jgi:hypothetical protein